MRERSNYIVNDSVQFRLLSDAQIEEIHYATLEILSSVGANIYDEEAREILKKGGCYVDGINVKFPPALVEWAIRTAPSRIVLCDRNGNRKLFLEGHKTYFGPGPTNTYHRDPFTGERRYPRKSDSARVALVCDALDNIDFLEDLGTPRDVNPKIADIHILEAMLNNSTKPIVHWGYTDVNYKYMLDMCIAIAGSLEEFQKYPFLALYGEPSPPLKHSEDALKKNIFCARHLIPQVYTPCTTAGATGPATLAGMIALSNAECLAGLVLAQLVREGAPFIMGGVVSIMDMKSTILSYGAPELSLAQAAFTEIAHYYKIPVFSTAGCTDSKLVDQQAALEAAISCLTAALSGANLVHDVGYTEYGSTGSLEMVVMVNEIIGLVRRIIEGIDVNPETLALDVIRAVGPGGHFLMEEHTFKYFKRESFIPSEIIDRQRYDAWVASGKKDLGQRVRDKIKAIVEGHKPEPLEEAIKKKLAEIVERAEQEVG